MPQNSATIEAGDPATSTATADIAARDAAYAGGDFTRLFAESVERQSHRPVRRVPRSSI